ncbi:hypothetical protein HXX76_004931 [Chlamydomonas incerta]|uniref:ATP-dependent DNA ligase family profile domain-containing protein n=1 Tax=Chlamydomonas incerta TaxID=51695 RepID=A0A835TFX1_CHLIN|nr:hypothetical protein HXX76_004931 [Chlamydomonas incerta]|eukprot:KAG2439579.1 hypothetical protein HXX76_004931 [Chlamydomonas incerta]
MQRRASGGPGAAAGASGPGGGPGGAAAAGGAGAAPAAVTVPAHKVIPGTGGAVTVDAFRYAHPGVKAYFLTHAHSDHYAGLSEAWAAGPVYCSPLTARLAAHLTGVAPAWLRPLPLGRPVVVEGLVEVTLVDANHCPGAVQLLFRVLPRGGSSSGGGGGGGGSSSGGGAGGGSSGGVRYLHCGDMRYSPAMQSWPQLAGWRGCEGVFLDTTYCQPKHTFPTQASSRPDIDEAVEYVASQVAAMWAEDQRQAAEEAAGTAGPAGPPAAAEEEQQPAVQQAAQQGAEPGAEVEPAAAAWGVCAPSEAEAAAPSPPTPGGGEGAGAGGGEQGPGPGGAESGGGGGGSCPTEREVGSGGSGRGPFRRLYLISTYVIGKERILLRIHERTGLRIHVSSNKLDVLRLLLPPEPEPQPQLEPEPAAGAVAASAAGAEAAAEAAAAGGGAAGAGRPAQDPPQAPAAVEAGAQEAGSQWLALPGGAARLADVFTDDPAASPVHVLGWGTLGDTWPYFRPNFVNMQRAAEIMGARGVVGFVPTGWTYEMKNSAFPVRCRGALSVHLVPYSEHSSYPELLEYVKWLRPRQVIPTVGVKAGDREGERARAAMLARFRGLVDETASKARFLAAMGGGRRRPAGGGAAGGEAAAGGGGGQGRGAAAGAGGEGEAAVGAVEVEVEVEVVQLEPGEEEEEVEEEAPAEGGQPQEQEPDPVQQPEPEPERDAVARSRTLGRGRQQQQGGKARAQRGQPAQPSAQARRGTASQRTGTGAGPAAAAAAPSTSNRRGAGAAIKEEEEEEEDVVVISSDDDSFEGGAGGITAAAPGAVAPSQGGEQGAGGGAVEPDGVGVGVGHADGASAGDGHGANDGGGDGGDGGDAVSRLMAVIGGAAVGRTQAEQLLTAARGDLAAAVNRFFDGGAASGGGAGAAPQPRSSSGRGSPAARGRGRGRGGAASRGRDGGGGGGSAAEGRPAKRPKLAAQGGAVSGMGSQGGAGGPGQRPITGFFGIRPKQEPKQEQEQSQGQAQGRGQERQAPPGSHPPPQPQGRGQAQPTQQRGQVKTEPGCEGAGAGAGAGAAAGEGGSQAAVAASGRQSRGAAGGTTAVAPAVEVEPGAKPGDDLGPRGPGPTSSSRCAKPAPDSEQQSRVHGAGQCERQRFPATTCAPAVLAEAMAPADGAAEADLARLPGDGDGSPTALPPPPPPPAKRPRLGLPRYASPAAAVAAAVATGAPGSAVSPAASPTGRAAAERASAERCGDTAAAAMQTTPGIANGGSDVVEPLASPASNSVGGGDGSRPEADRGRSGGATAPMHPFFTRQGAAGGHTQSPAASGRGRGAKGRAGHAGGRASARSGPVPASAAAAAVPGVAGGAAPPHAQQEAAEAGASGGHRGGDTAQVEPPEDHGDQRQLMAATLPPASAAAAASAAPAPPPAAAAAAAPATSWEACQEALLLPLESFDPLRHACWGPAHGSSSGGSAAAAGGRGPTPYLHVALCLSALSSTSKRLAMADALTNMFRSVLAAADDPGRDLVAALYLVTGRIAPEYDKTELNVGGATVSGALQAATGASAARLKQLYREHGDLGDVAAACRRTQSTLRSPAPLLCGRLLAALREVAADKGQGVAARRQGVVLGLLRACRDVEVRFLVRTLISNLRVGANWRSVLAPLGRAILLHQRAATMTAHADGAAAAAAVPLPPPPAPGKGGRGGGGGGSKAAVARQRGAAAAAALGCSKAELEAAGAAVLEAYHTCPNFEILVPVLLQHGIEGLRSRCGLTLGVPLKPMLANACAGVADGLLQLQSASPAAVAAASAAAAAAAGAVGSSASGATAAGAPAPAGPSASASAPLVLPPVLVEYKYDGRRAQIHLLPDGRVAIFSRNCEDVTDAHPDVCAMVRAAAAAGPAAAGPAAAPVGAAAGPGEPAEAAAHLPAQPGAPATDAGTSPRTGAGHATRATRVPADAAAPAAAAPGPAAGGAAAGTSSLILDAEVVAVEWLPEEEVAAAAEAAEAEGAPPPPGYRLKAFQELATRARGQVEQHQVTVQVCVFVFDLLEWNGTSLLHRPLRERRSLLPAALPGMSPGRVMLATAVELQPLQPLQPAAAGEEDGEEGPVAAALVRMWPAPGEPGARRPEEVASDAAALQAAAAAVAATVPAAAGGKQRRRRAPASAAAAAAAEEARVKLERGADAAAAAASAAAAPARAPAVVDLLTSDEDDAAGGSDHHQHSRQHQHHDKSRAAGDVSQPELDLHAEAAASSPAGAAAADSGRRAPTAQEQPSLSEPQPASKAVMELLLQSFNTGAEGLMLKRLDGAAAYEPSRRSEGWIKVKRDYCEGLRDSVDVVPIGAWYGQGRKVKWFSPYLLAVWDPVREEFQSLCRCMSGFSDEFYAAARERLGATIIPGPKPYYNTGERCSVWFEPTEVWELRGADLTLSPVHRAAAGRLHAERGVGMRFPRFIRMRDDKRPEDATTPDDIVHLYNKQTRKVDLRVVGGRGGSAAGRAGPGLPAGASAGAAKAPQAEQGHGDGDSDRGARERSSEDGNEEGRMREGGADGVRQEAWDEGDTQDEAEGRVERDAGDRSG